MVLLRSRLSADRHCSLALCQERYTSPFYTVGSQVHLCATASSAVKNLYLGLAPRIRLRWSSGRPFTCPGGEAMASMRPAIIAAPLHMALHWTIRQKQHQSFDGLAWDEGQSGVIAAGTASFPLAVQSNVAAWQQRRLTWRLQAPEHEGQHMRAASIRVAAPRGGA